MNVYRVYSKQMVYYTTKIEAESEQEVLEKFWDAEMGSVDEYGTVEVDNIEIIEKGETT